MPSCVRSPMATDEQKKCFDLLNESHVWARYGRGCKITKEQLEYLGQRVKYLRQLTEKICKEKGREFKYLIPTTAVGVTKSVM